ncbi:hypothetical protein C3K47_12525 [Solitalea longa]|uniref:DUF1905 domain-containing protein n=1 Tax=Solitalea longa TaxID=2079460 RepID=A0A2S5A186_9SPHI|nr:YdeI/OmpD-associated family protein [Solitalea longa]POY36022.1 hypothetical protein C3K47_12525 [Solitalea longa]
MASLNLIIDSTVQLQRFPMKGGWTFAPIELEVVNTKPFNYLKVKGFIDEYEIVESHLMPLGNGKLFLPVKAEIRKKIKKEVGDWVKLVLYKFLDIDVSTDTFLECLEDDPVAWSKFQQFTSEERSHYVQWIFSSASEEIQIQRMASAINNIAQGIKLPKPGKKK